MRGKEGEEAKPKLQPEPVEVKVKPHTYQPSKAELEADIHVDATPEELRTALVRPVIVKAED